MPARKPPTKKSATAAAKKGLAPKGKAGPPKPSRPQQAQKGLPGKLRKPSIPGIGPLPAPPPMPTSAQFSMNAPPLTSPTPPTMGGGHMSNARNPKGVGLPGGKKR